MVAGHLREKKGYFYAVLNYTDAHGNRKTMCRLQETFFLQTSWNNGLR